MGEKTPIPDFAFMADPQSVTASMKNQQTAKNDIRTNITSLSGCTKKKRWYNVNSNEQCPDSANEGIVLARYSIVSGERIGRMREIHGECVNANVCKHVSERSKNR